MPRGLDLFMIPALLGSALILVRFIRIFFRLDINMKAFLGKVIQLIRANNLARAIQLCHVVPQVPFAKGAIAVLQAWDGGTNDTQTLRGTFENAIPGLARTVNRFRYLSLVSAALAALSAVLLFSKLYSFHHWGSLCILAVLMLVVISELRARKIIKYSERGLEELLSALMQEIGVEPETSDQEGKDAYKMAYESLDRFLGEVGPNWDPTTDTNATFMLFGLASELSKYDRKAVTRAIANFTVEKNYGRALRIFFQGPLLRAATDPNELRKLVERFR